MKHLLSLTAIALCFCATQAMAASDSATGNSKAKIISPVTITAVTGASGDLNFGTMLSSSAHVVTVDNANGRTSTVSSMLVDDSANPSHSGVFTVNNGGSAAVTATLALPSSATVSNGTDTLTVNNFTSNFPTGSGNIHTGDTTVMVGADLNVTANASSGDYTGTYNVTLSY